MGIQTEITTDPLTRGYSAMTDTQVAASLNTADRSVNVGVVSARSLMGVIGGEISAMTDANVNKLSLVLIDGFYDPNSDAGTFIESLFTGAVLTSVQALKTKTVSRAAELGLGVVTSQQVMDARSNS